MDPSVLSTTSTLTPATLANPNSTLAVQYLLRFCSHHDNPVTFVQLLTDMHLINIFVLLCISNNLEPASSGRHVAENHLRQSAPPSS